jgi:hypothetical protein
MPMKHVRTRSLAVLLLCVFAAACASGPSASSSEGSRLGATLVVERFLRASNANDLDTMAQLFGDREGPFNRMGSKKENDDRMFVLATVLRHTASQIKGEGDPVSGRRDEAFNLMVELTQNQRKTTLPFRMVRYKGSWLIEDIPITMLTNPR